jgi:hypothetical protein
MRGLNRTFFGLLLVVASMGGSLACTSTVSDAGLTTSTGGGGCTGGCPTGDVCQNNMCVSTCVASGGTLCGTICVNTQTDNANCGACAKACTSGEACSAGNCAATCAPGYDVCTTDGGFYCAVLAGDNNNCGTCGKVCQTGYYCSVGTCTPSSNSCPQGLTLCVLDGGVGSCVNLASDNNNCGTCAKGCSAGASCLDSMCQSGPDCPNGLLACPNATGGTTCVAYLLDPNNCGGCNRSCGANGICSQGGCACPGLYTQCGTTSAPACFALQFDAANCGTCGHECVTCENCTLGSCAPQAFLTAAAAGLPQLDGGNYGAIVVGDFNGDGVNDLATAEGQSVAVFFGIDGGFGNATVLPVSAYQYGIVMLAPGDFNGDGVTDIAVGYITDAYAAVVSVFLGSTNAGFSAVGPFGIDSMSFSVSAMATGDFNADTFQDIAVLEGSSSNALTVLYGDGTGGFSAVGGLPGDISGGYAVFASLTSGDVNGDGVADLAMAYTLYSGSATSGVLEVLFGSDAGINSTNVAKVSANLSGALALNGNEIDAFAPGQLSPYLWNADAGLVAAGSYNIVAAPYSSPTAAAAADMNGDGLVDVVALVQNTIMVWLRNDAGFGSPLSVLAGAGGMAVGDFNGDGTPDVTTTNGYAGPGGSIFLNTCQ